MYYKVLYGSFGGLHPSDVPDSAPTAASGPQEGGAVDVLVDPSTVTGANSGFGVPLPNGNGNPSPSGALHGGAGGAVVSAAAVAVDAGDDDDDSAVIDGFFSSDAVVGSGSDGSTAVGATAASLAHGGSNGGHQAGGGANGDPRTHSKGSGDDARLLLPGLISPGAPHDVVTEESRSCGGGGDDGGGEGEDGGGIVVPSPAGGDLAEAERVEEQGVPVVATSVPFATATAPFDHVSFFRDMKLVSPGRCDGLLVSNPAHSVLSASGSLNRCDPYDRLGACLLPPPVCAGLAFVEGTLGLRKFDAAVAGARPRPQRERRWPARHVVPPLPALLTTVDDTNVIPPLRPPSSPPAPLAFSQHHMHDTADLEERPEV